MSSKYIAIYKLYQKNLMSLSNFTNDELIYYNPLLRDLRDNFLKGNRILLKVLMQQKLFYYFFDKNILL